jgi:hypothetical protein
MSLHKTDFRMSLLATSIALSLMNTGCGGAEDTAAAVTEAAVANAEAITLEVDETSKRLRDLIRSRLAVYRTTSTDATIQTTTTSTTTAGSTPITSIPTTNTTTAISTPTTSTSTSTSTEGSLPTTTVSGTTSNNSTSILPTSLPLIQSTDVTYMGAFSTPENSGFTGRAVAVDRNTVTGKSSLFYRGHDQSPDQVAQISIPDVLSKSAIYTDLPKGIFIQQWAYLTEGKLNTEPSGIGNAAGNGAFIYGLLKHNEKLIVSATTYYSYEQTASIGVSGTNLISTVDFQGFYALTGKVEIQRAMGGSMAHIPPEWQSSLGGSAIVGNAPVSVISANSFGPSITVFSPESLGTSKSAETLVFYPQSNPLCGTRGCEQTLNPNYTWMSGYTGRAFPKASRTILAVGIHPTGEMWYGGPTSPLGSKAFCDDGGWGQKATGMETRVLAFDANDLLAVKSGLKKNWEVKPYANWRLPEVERSSCWDIMSSTFDIESGLLYVITRDVESKSQGNRVHVYRIAKP